VTAGITARGETLEAAFIQAALDVLALGLDPAAVEPRDLREVRAHGASLEELFAHWIGETGYVLELEGFACHAIELVVFDVEPGVGGEPLRLHALLRGEEFDPGKHRAEGAPRTFSARDVSIRPTANGYEIRLMVDT
jgi:SHS2 domain-containing protein